jgi:monoamine oxidase
VAPERISTLELGRYVWSPDDRPVMEGYGALLRRHFSDVPVTTGAPVRAIDWGRDPVRVETPQGTVEARAAIVTVSTGVLGAEAIAFRPGLPDWKRDAIAALPMASALKIGLRLAAPVHDGGVALLYAVTRAGIPMDIELWPAANPGATCYIDGPPAARLERDGGPAAAREAAVEGMAEIFGARVRSGVRAALVTEWGDDPWTRGTYSNALPGAGDCRARLARPLDDRLYFAGEAATEEYSGDVQGASDSGRAAAGAILTRR